MRSSAASTSGGCCGLDRRYVSTWERSPPVQRRRCSVSVAAAQPAGGVASGIVGLVEAQLAGDAIHGPRQLLAQGLRAVAQLRGEFVPALALGTLLGEIALFAGHALAGFRQQLGPADHFAGTLAP